MNEKIDPTISQLLSKASVEAIRELRRLVRFGWQTSCKKTNDPLPETPAAAAKYADVRLKAVCRILDLRFGTKPHGALTPEARDQEMEQLKQIAALPFAERRQFFKDAVERGDCTDEEAQALRLTVEEMVDGPETDTEIIGPGKDN